MIDPETTKRSETGAVELRDEELENIRGGIIAVLIGLAKSDSPDDQVGTQTTGVRQPG